MPLSARTRRILLIDDDPDIADTLGMVIGLWGYDVEISRGGPDGVDLAADFRPDVALLDISMPVMDGYETARELRRRVGSSLILVAMTGQDRVGPGFDHYL